MNGSAAVDSNAYVALCSSDVNAASLIGSFHTVFLPVVVLGELLYGAGASARAAENRRKVDEFAGKCKVLEVTVAVAERYSELRLQLRHVGTPIPDNDLWIAATCIVEGVPLITRDGHFGHLSMLQTLAW
jgi:tRNA(fMet)-specific endonuclease VapC